MSALRARTDLWIAPSAEQVSCCGATVVRRRASLDAGRTCELRARWLQCAKRLSGSPGSVERAEGRKSYATFAPWRGGCNDCLACKALANRPACTRKVHSVKDACVA